MRGERWLLRLGDFLVYAATRRLPRRVRDDRYREWTAELPVILHDPDGGSWPQRAGRMLGYALDTIRGTTVTPRPAPYRGTHSGEPDFTWLGLLSVLVGISLVGSYAYFVGTTGFNLGFWATAWLAAGFILARDAITRRRRASGPWVRSVPWSRIGFIVLASGQIALLAARHAHWRAGQLHVVSLASWGTTAAFVACNGIGLVAWIWPLRQLRPQRRQPP